MNFALTAGTWALTASGTRSTLNTAATASDPRYAGSCVMFRINADQTAGYTLKAQYTFTTPFGMNDMTFSALVWHDKGASATNDFLSSPLMVRMSVDAAADTYTNCLYGSRRVSSGRWTLLKFAGRRDTRIPEDIDHGWTVTGTVPHDATFKRMNFEMTGATNHTPKVEVRQMAFGGASPTIVIIGFDDGFASFYSTVYPLLQTYNLKATHYIISITIGSGGYMTLANLKAMDKRYVSFANHTATHWATATVASKTQAEIQTDIETCGAFLVSNGLNDAHDSVKDVAWPYGGDLRGSLMSKIEGACAAAGVRSIRSTAPGYDGYANSDPRHLPCWMLAVTDTTTASSSVKASIRSVLASGGGVVRLLFHNVSDADATSTGYPVDEFTEIIKFIADLNNAGVVTNMSEAEFQTMSVLEDALL